MISLLTVTAACALLNAIAHTALALDVEVFQPGEVGHFVNSGIVSSTKSVMIIDAQLSLVYGRHLTDRVKELNKTVKAIYITHGHSDHYWGLGELVQAFPDAEIIASQQTVDKMTAEAPMSLRPDALRPFPNNLGGPKFVIIPKVYNKDTYDLDGEQISMLHAWISLLRVLFTGTSCTSKS